MDTIFALATARGRAGLAVIRVSGPDAWAVGKALAGPGLVARRAVLRCLYDGSGELLDRALVVPFAAGSSFTGEPVVEFFVHGSPAVVSAVERAIGACSGVRYALPGEFTRRALSNDVMDLVQVEALADLIDADTEHQRKQAMTLLEGALGRLVGEWRTRLLRASALMAAEIDFADEELGAFGSEALAAIAPVCRGIHAELAGIRGRERIRSGFNVTIVGPVNSGKSTLLNALAGREAAITSATAGTTRDVIAVQMEIGGHSVTIMDTAGIREAADDVERRGVELALRHADEADVRIILRSTPDEGPVLAARDEDIVLLAKGDLHDGAGDSVSGLTGAGVDDLVLRLSERFKKMVPTDGVAVRERHQTAMRRAGESLRAAECALAAGGYEPELVAADLWSAMSALDQLIGRTDVEAVLGEIFASFCVGK